ncbi:MAG TPA: diaminopimelate decarboxylase [Actinomycetota bacterium]|nr:diaminopimelate decarboxylase [Actinomycetota bacterium]
MPDPWPRSARWTSAGLTVGGRAAADLADRFGTPLLVIDEADMRQRMRAMTSAFPRVAYAVKAMTCAAVIRAALEERLDLLCASGGEVATCLRAGAPASRVLLHGNAKTDDELTAAVEASLGAVIVDDAQELDRLGAIARGAGVAQAVLLRVTPDVEVETHEAIATGHAASKFGVPLAAAADVARRASATAGIRLIGLHAHAGSQVLDVDAHVRVVRALLGVAVDAGIRPAIIDVGGGFGVTYTDETPSDVVAVAAALRDELDANGSDAALQIEPGRAIIANPGLTLYRVLSRKQAGGRNLVAIDGGMSDNLRPALYDARHDVAAVSNGNGPTEQVTVVGRHCESGDVVVDDVSLSTGLARGDLLAVAATGAYTYPLASAYNRFGRPAVVGVRDGDATLWLRREDVDDMDRLDVILGTPWGAGALPTAEGGART